VNAAIDLSVLPIQHYATVDTAVARVVDLQASDSEQLGVFAAKIDVEAAYRQIPVRMADWWHQVYVWEGKFLVDTRLPFGLRSAPHHFTRITQALVFMMAARGASVKGYLDDFLMLELGAVRCAQVVDSMVELFAELGLPVQQKKLAAEGTPTQVITFLGIELDTVAMEMRLPAARVVLLQTLLVSWTGRDRAQVKDLQSLVGHLMFAAKQGGEARPHVCGQAAAAAAGARD
jgi:hypothetical protein